MSDPKRYDVGMTTEFNPHGFNHSFPRVYEAEQGRYVEYEDYARLKAELDKYRKDVTNSVDDLLDERKRLKAEVERLTAIVGADAIDREHGMCCDASAQVERLIKAGDAMADMAQFIRPMEGLCKEWNAAKEGKQSK